MDNITELIGRVHAGEPHAKDNLFTALYPELHRLAQARIRRNQPITLVDTTSLLHESYIKLINTGELRAVDRNQFMAYAASIMRSVITDFAKARLRDRRGGGAAEVTLDTEISNNVPSEESDILRVHEALQELAKADPRLVQVVEMRYFAGLTEMEIADALGVTDRTVRRDWEKAKRMLAIALK